jgi:translation elongation factor EF-Ts
VRDRAFSRAIQARASLSPSEASQWIGSISSQTLKIAAAEEVARIWLQRDRTAATAWLATQDLPDDVLKKIVRGKSGG